MDTIKVERASAKFIAHRGLSGIETENTVAAFLAAAKRSYYGIETDVHLTKDGKFILIHDDRTKRLCGTDYIVEETDFDVLRSLKLKDKWENANGQGLYLPTPEEYFSICKKYGKTAVFELKNIIEPAKISELYNLIGSMNMLENTVFISFFLENLIELRKISKSIAAEYLTKKIHSVTELCDTLQKYLLSLDADYRCITEDVVKAVHAIGKEVNVWVVNEALDAKRLCDMGVDYITTNILE